MKDFKEITNPSNWELHELLGYCRTLKIPIHAISNVDMYDKNNLARIVKEDIAKHIKRVDL